MCRRDNNRPKSTRPSTGLQYSEKTPQPKTWTSFTTFIQVRGLALYNQVQSTIFYIWKRLYQVRNMTVVVHLPFDVFCHLILPFDWGLSFMNFPRSSVFLWFYFLMRLKNIIKWYKLNLYSMITHTGIKRRASVSWVLS